VELPLALAASFHQDDAVLWGDPLCGPWERLELPEVREVQISAGGGDFGEAIVLSPLYSFILDIIWLWINTYSLYIPFLGG